MTIEPDVETIVKGLTKVQQDAIVSGFACSGHTRTALIRGGLAVGRHRGLRNYHTFALTPFGQRVAAYLKEQSNAG